MQDIVSESNIKYTSINEGSNKEFFFFKNYHLKNLHTEKLNKFNKVFELTVIIEECEDNIHNMV